ncbi:Pisatin demethylase, partial [Fusarium austroafricanum]
TEFYQNNSLLLDGKIVHNMFSTASPTEHACLVKPVAKYYSSSSVLAMETQMNLVIEEFCTHLEKRFLENGDTCDLGEWFGFYTWDMLSQLTFSQTFGYMQKAKDFDDSIRSNALGADYFGLIGQIPFLDSLLAKNPVVRIGPPPLSNAIQFTVTRLQERFEKRKTDKNRGKADFMDHFINAMEEHPDIVDTQRVLVYLIGNVVAGSDTTAITLRAIFDFLLHNPHALKKLQDEVIAADFNPDKAVPYSSARSLSYLDAVIRESMRMHPSVAMLLERYVLIVLNQKCIF